MVQAQVDSIGDITIQGVFDCYEYGISKLDKLKCTEYIFLMFNIKLSLVKTTY